MMPLWKEANIIFDFFSTTLEDKHSAVESFLLAAWRSSFPLSRFFSVSIVNNRASSTTLPTAWMNAQTKS
jgi:hypothetical protein